MILKRKTPWRLIPFLLLVAILFAGCDVPDITEFSNQSAEMTRGIRKGVNDTQGLIKTASERDDLYSQATRTRLKADLKKYQAALKPTLAALDGLDSYLNALNALAQANKKSGENAAGVVTSITELVTAVSGFTFASPLVNVGKGLLTLAEQFRTSRDFRQRVTLAAEIVEGVHPKRDEDGKVMKDKSGNVIFVRMCTDEAADQIAEAGDKISSIIDPIMASLSEDELKAMKPLTPAERRSLLHLNGKLKDGPYAQVSMAEAKINSFGCGVIDLIKFNIRDLKKINAAASQSMLDNNKFNNRTVLGYYESIAATDRRIQNELETILNYENLLALIKQHELEGADNATLMEGKTRLKNQADSLFIVDAPLQTDVFNSLNQCGARCLKVKGFLAFNLCSTCEAPFLVYLSGMSKSDFDYGNSYVVKVFDARARALRAQNELLVAEMARIQPAHSDVVTDLKTIRDKQVQLDQLLDSSMSALDAWSKSHANLRVAVNTKKPLSVAQLASKVREIWEIINP